MKSAKRLLDQIVPVHYRLSFTPDFSDFTFAGAEVVTFSVDHPVEQLEFHCVDLKIDSAILGKNNHATAITYQKDNQTVTFSFASEIQAGTHQLELLFFGPLRDDMHGFYRSSYTHQGQEKWLAVTQLEPISAREVFICIDEPAAKATFDLGLIIDQNLTAIANTNIVSESPFSGHKKQKEVRFAVTPKMSPYLLAFLVGEFDHQTALTKEGVEVGVYTTPGKIYQASFALEIAAKMLSFYGDYFGIAYPLPKLDMIAIPDFAAGAMENWGAVTYREVALLVDPDNSALANKQRVAMVVAHELAHQWFGNLVTMSWWTDLWLNEGFASWIEYLALDHLFPEWQMWVQFVADDYLAARNLDALANTHPIEVTVHHPREIEEIFDEISYQKGASVIRMLFSYIGETAFRAGLHAYLEKFAYGNAVTADLWQELEIAAEKPVRQIMSTWTSKPGFPLLGFESNGSEIKLSQERFLANPNDNTHEATVWPIPLAWQTDGGEEANQLFDQAKGVTTLRSSSKWLKPNPDQTGFFITNYSPDQLASFAEPLHRDEIPVIDRLGLVSDITALAGSGHLGGDQILKLAAQLRGETNYAVWNGLFDGLGDLFTIADEPMHAKLEQFAVWLIKSRLDELGWSPKPGEPYFDTLLRPLLIGLAGRCGDEEILAESRRRFAAHVKGQTIPPDLRTAIYRSVAKHGTAQDYEQMLRMYQSTDLQEEGRRLLAALGSFHNEELCQRSLKFALSKAVRSQDTPSLVLFTLMNRVGRQPAWQFMQANWSELVKRYGQGGHLLPRFVQGLEVFNTYAKADEVEAFFAAHPTPGIERTVKQTLEKIRQQADWFKRDQAKLNQFLDNSKLN